ncbi:MAG TPA: Flp family type IVb pilin [Microthrixaceae bacterium]|nr:Flp family type IVb pilin [Microthrixaceae bacterium]
MAKHQMWKWDREERGATAVEYGLMVAAIAAVIALAVITLGGTVNDSFNDTNDAITP